MAESGVESTLGQAPAAEGRPGLHCHYLYHNRFTAGSDYAIASHEHLYWHVEFVKNGLLQTTVGGAAFETAAGGSILLPPRVPHSFVYRDEATTVFSVKFELHDMARTAAPVARGPLPETKAISAALDSLLEHQRWPSQDKLAAVDHLLAAFVHLAMQRPGSDDSLRRITLADMVKEVVERAEGRGVTVRSISKELGFSETHVRSQFRALEGVSLKEYIDRHRANVAVKYLAYSDIPIKEIVQRMGFPDPQCFSRFCTRLTGRSPKHIRRQLVDGTNLRH
jgi:AraC-like DNA-binding protein